MKRAVFIVGLLLACLLAAPQAEAKAAQSTAWNAPGTPWPVYIKFHDGFTVNLLPGNTTTLTHGGFYGIYNGVGTCEVVWFLQGGVWYNQATILADSGWTYLPDGKQYGINGGYKNSQGQCNYRT